MHEKSWGGGEGGRGKKIANKESFSAHQIVMSRASHMNISSISNTYKLLVAVTRL